MSTLRMGAFAPFRVASYRFQWTADLATSWAFEMETLILGWYVLAATGSVKLLVLFGALQWAGSLFSPLFGVAGDRFGHRRILLVTRFGYGVLAGVLMLLTVSGRLEPWHVFVIAGLVGLVRPSDTVMRNALIAQTMSQTQLLGALSLSRTTIDTARIAGALAGAAGGALFGMGPAYVAITLFHFTSFLLTLRVAGRPAREGHAAVVATPIADLALAFTYVWHRPAILAAAALAFLINLLAFPFYLGLLPYVAKEVFQAGQTGLGYLAAAFAFGGLLGSMVLGLWQRSLPPGRTMLASAVGWFALVLGLAATRDLALGVLLLVAAGLIQNLCLMPLAAVMLQESEERMRGRVMGMRILAIWGLPIGLLAAGPLISAWGFTAICAGYALLGLAATLAIAWRWRAALWSRAARVNRT
jgi:MFS family permease